MLYQDTVKETGRGEGGYRQMGGGEKEGGNRLVQERDVLERMGDRRR